MSKLINFDALSNNQKSHGFPIISVGVEVNLFKLASYQKRNLKTIS